MDITKRIFCCKCGANNPMPRGYVDLESKDIQTFSCRPFQTRRKWQYACSVCGEMYYYRVPWVLKENLIF